jgi:hypothetical protein
MNEHIAEAVHGRRLVAGVLAMGVGAALFTGVGNADDGSEAAASAKAVTLPSPPRTVVVFTRQEFNITRLGPNFCRVDYSSGERVVTGWTASGTSCDVLYPEGHDPGDAR